MTVTTRPRFNAYPAHGTFPDTAPENKMHFVFDEVGQEEVFHWRGPSGLKYCRAVAEALNASAQDRDGSD